MLASNSLKPTRSQTCLNLFVLKVLSEQAVEQRLRRACTNGRRKKASGGKDAVEMYQDPRNRDDLAHLLIGAKFAKVTWIISHMHVLSGMCACGSHNLEAQAAFHREVTKYIQKERSKREETKAGWYTESAMATQLKMGPPQTQPFVSYLCGASITAWLMFQSSL